ncbi:MAG: GNAT family N-acetyltransferase [Bacteroidota bacterium]
METIIPPVDRDLLEKELTREKYLRKANFGNAEIYLFTHHNSPMLMREVARLREVTFREAGGGTGKALDIDKFDTSDTPYQQLIVWDPEDREITGAYRFIRGKDVMDNVEEKLATTRLFRFSTKFIQEYLPYTIELGRSIVQPKYQFANNRKKGIYALDNLWDGLGALVVKYPDMKFFFGKITMYKHFDQQARDFILTFINLYFPNKDRLVEAIDPIPVNTEKHDDIFHGNDYKKDYAILSKKVRSFGENIPPLFNAYMNLSPSMQTFGTVENPHFGGVEETGIMINIQDIYESKKKRHVGSIK